MQARTWLAVAGLVAGTSAGLKAQGAFEGVVSMSMMAGKGQRPAEIVQMMKGSRSRQEMNVGGKGAVTIIDMAAGTLTTLLPEQKMYMKMNLRQTAQAMERKAPDGRSSGPAAPIGPPKIASTGKSEVVAGRTCEHYLMGDAPQQFDVCAAKGMGYFGMGGGSPMGGGMPGLGASSVAGVLPPGWSDAVKAFADGFFPLKLERIEGAKRELVMQVNKVEAKSLEDALFAPPPDYKEMKIPALPFGPKQ